MLGFFDRARAIYRFVGQPPLFFHRHLRRDAHLSLLGCKAALFQTLDLLFGPAPADHHFIELLVIVRFDDQRSFDNGKIRPARLIECRKPFAHHVQDAWMEDLIQACAFLRIREDDWTELAAVHVAIVIQNFLAEFAHDFVIGRLPLLE